MSVKTASVEYNGEHVTIKYTNFNSLKDKTRTKFELSTDFYLRYPNDDGGTLRICDDDDLEAVPDNSKLEVVIKKTTKEKTHYSGTPGNQGFQEFGDNNKHVGDRVMGNKTTTSKAGRDYIDGDKITATNMAKVGNLQGTMNIGGKQNNHQYGAYAANGNAQNISGNMSGILAGGNVTTRDNISHSTVTKNKDSPVVEKYETEESDFFFTHFDSATFDAEKLAKKALKLPKQPKEADASKAQRYFIDPAYKSQALIFNLLFPSCNDKVQRKGAKKDSSSLKILLNYLGFETQIETKDQTEEEMKITIDKFLNSKKVATAPMVLLFIGSHGEQDESGADYFLDAKQNRVKLKSIVDMFATKENFKVLEGKPKLFLLQFCRNEVLSEKPQSDDGNKTFISWYNRQSPRTDAVPNNSDKLADMFLGYATKRRFSAYRVGSGSWFVMSLCVAFFKNAHEDEFQTLFEKANHEVQKRSSDASEKKEYEQVCDHYNGLKKDLYFYSN